MNLNLLLLSFLWIGIGTALCQNTNTRQQELETQRVRLKNEIKQINELLFSNKNTRKNIIVEVENLQVKLNVRNELIKVTNAQVNLITRKININERNITSQRKELGLLKEEYAKMIKNSYASKSFQNRLMFLFSSKDLLQAYKRIQYLKQYTQYRRKQGIIIGEKTKLLQQLNNVLIEERQKKVTLINENKQEQAQLEKENISQQILIKSLKQKERNLSLQISKKEKQARTIDKEIDRLIREAIAESNKSDVVGRGKEFFKLTPEAKLISTNFEANRGLLPWPLEKGVVVQGFGRQKHPVVKTATIQSNGVTIATEPSSKVRAIFEGEVMSVLTFKGSNPSVLIRHGNYITVYKNLGELYVKKGDKVKSKEVIGEVFTNQQTGKTEVQFSIFNNIKVLNPIGWIYQM